MSEEQIKEGEPIEPVFREVYVKLRLGRGEEFVLPQGIVNYYSLCSGDALHCELVWLKKKMQADPQPIEKDILVDVKDGFLDIEELDGRFPDATFDLYGMENYEYALLRIKKKIAGR